MDRCAGYPEEIAWAVLCMSTTESPRDRAE